MMRVLHSVYNPAFDLAMKYKKSAIAFSLAPMVLCAVLFPLLGREFMPKLEEGNFWIRATLPMSISLDQSARYVGRMRSILRGCPADPNAPCDDAHRKHPEVETVVSQLGRPDDGTDVSGFYNIEFFAPLKPFDEWPRGLTKQKLTEDINLEMTEAFPGVIFNFSQYISDNVEEALSGVKGENSVKVFGKDIEKNEAIANAIVDVMGKVPGIADLGLFQSLGQPGDQDNTQTVGLRSLRPQHRRRRCRHPGRHRRAGTDPGVRRGEVLRSHGAMEAAIPNEPRSHPRRLRSPTPDGTSIPLGQIADIETGEGPAMIYREDGERYSPVKFSVRGRDLAGTISEAQAAIDEQIPRCDRAPAGWSKPCRPYDSRLEWGGEINELHEAEGRLKIIIPLTMLLITFLTYSAVKTWMDTILVIVSIPIACTGGVLALLISGQNFSVSAAMGFISIFGIAIQDAILVVTYFQRLRNSEGHSIELAAREAAEKRFRPVLMTTLVATLGLLPAALSNGIGSQTQKPLAIVVIGGSLILAS